MIRLNFWFSIVLLLDVICSSNKSCYSAYFGYSQLSNVVGIKTKRELLWSAGIPPASSSLFITFLVNSWERPHRTPSNVPNRFSQIGKCFVSCFAQRRQKPSLFFVRYSCCHCRPVRVWKVSFSVTQALPFMSCVVHVDLSCPPGTAEPPPPLPSPSTMITKIPRVCLDACWLSEVQWTVQIARGVENSFVTGTLLSAKARWSSVVAALSMWNCFFSQETWGFSPSTRPVERSGRSPDENRPTLSSL